MFANISLWFSFPFPFNVWLHVYLHMHVFIQDCFSMANISWYGGASVRGQTWPINDQNATMQPFIVSDLKDNPSGFGSALERYFLGSSGKRSLMGFALDLVVRNGFRNLLHGYVITRKKISSVRMLAVCHACYWCSVRTRTRTLETWSHMSGNTMCGVNPRARGKPCGCCCVVLPFSAPHVSIYALAGKNGTKAASLKHTQHTR